MDFYQHTNGAWDGLKFTLRVVAEECGARGRNFRRGKRVVVDGRLIGSAGRRPSGEFRFFDSKYDKYERFPKNPEVFGAQVWNKYAKYGAKFGGRLALTAGGACGAGRSKAEPRNEGRRTDCENEQFDEMLAVFDEFFGF